MRHCHVGINRACQHALMSLVLLNAGGNPLIAISKNQARRAKLGRFVLSLFVLAWASASAEPCLMALESGDGVLVAAHAGHGQPAARHTSAHHCSHCLPGGGLCASGVNADCGSLPVFSAGERHVQPKLKHPLPVPVVIEALWHNGQVAAGPPVTFIDLHQLGQSPGPSLSIRHCVFLK